MVRENFSDEVIILKVSNWQTADKYAVCYSLEHGKFAFIAYGARYSKNIAGRLLQPFARLKVEVTAGQRVERLKSCELTSLPQRLDFKQLAYAAVAAELTEIFTEKHQPQREIYCLLDGALNALVMRNPRLVTLAFALQLVGLAGFAPEFQSCACCGKALPPEADAYFSPLQGGAVCGECAAGSEPFGSGARKLALVLQELNFLRMQHFSVRGGDLMELERLLYKFILFQTDKPLKSLEFLSQTGL